MRLHAEESGSGDRIVLIHGFTQTGRCWGAVGADLESDHQVVRIDAPGHGRSNAVVADLVEGAALIGAAGGPATYLGYSMGGRYALHLALARPDLVERLVLIGATAGIDDPAERAARRESDRATTARIAELGVTGFLAEWMAMPMFAGIPPEAQFVDERATNTVEGLASSLELSGTGTQDPSWDHVNQLEMPVLVVAGADDVKFAALGRRLVDSIGTNAELALVPDAGHAAHLERPADFLGLLRPWLARSSSGPASRP